MDRSSPLAQTRILHHPAISVALVLGVMIAAWIEAGVATFTWPATVTTAATSVVVVAVATFRRRSRHGRGSGGGKGGRNTRVEQLGPTSGAVRVTGTLAWVGVAAAFVGWELAELFRLPRSAHPTLSSLTQPYVGPGHYVARAAAFVAWAAIGWVLARR